MRWEDERQSENVEDARGFSLGGRRGAGIGCGGLILIFIIAKLTGINPLALLDVAQQVSSGQTQVQEPGRPAQPGPSGQPGRPGQPGDQLGRFASAVLASTEDVWKDIFATMGRTYTDPRLVLFTGAIFFPLLKLYVNPNVTICVSATCLRFTSTLPYWVRPFNFCVWKISRAVKRSTPLFFNTC